MLMNNLDPEVTERPEEPVVDGDLRRAGEHTPPCAEEAGLVSNPRAVLQGLMSRLERDLRLCVKTLASFGDLTEGTAEHPRRESVFLVHGRNVGQRETVARFVERLGPEVVLLDEKAGESRTVIESFERHASEVGYAVALLTGDDVGGLRGTDVERQRSRARQNVIFELGFFIGSLGRGRVCLLYEDGVEIPSDSNGMLYVKLDDQGAWRLSLARELKTAGLEVDLNRAI
jgi:predicted nucleotide-binding protein